MPIAPVVITDLHVKQIASLAAMGATNSQIATQLNVSKYLVKKVMLTAEFKAAVVDIGDSAMTNAKQVIRANTGELANEIMRVLKSQLTEDNLEAVKIALKILGFDQQEQTQGDTNIQVVLPGQTAPTPEREFSIIAQDEGTNDN